MSGALTQGIPQRLTAFVNPQTGLMSPEWWHFLHSIWLRGGGTVPSINNTPIGNTNPSTGAFTTLSATSTVSGAGFTNLFASPPPIGSTVANTGAFTTATLGGTLANKLTATGSAATFAPTLTATGSDTNIGFRFVPKGTGAFETIKAKFGTANGTPASFTSTNVLALQANPTYSTTVTPALSINGSFGGTVTSGQAFHYSITAGADTVDSSAIIGSTLLFVGHTLSAGAKGERTTFETFFNQAGATTAAPQTYYVSSAAEAFASFNAGGSAGAGNARGNLIGFNSLSQLNAGATYFNSVASAEFDVAAAVSPAYKMGVTIVTLSTDTASGTVGADAGLTILTQGSGTPQGWDVGIAFTHPFGWWAIKSTGTIIGTGLATMAGSPALQAAYGVDFTGVAFGTAAFKSTGFTVDGSGNTTAATFVSATNNAVRLTGQTSGAAAAAGTLLNAPSAGNPAFWLPVTINGVTRYIPAW